MPSTELMRLWKLAQIDRSIADIRNRASKLDVGQKIQAEMDVLAAEEAVVGGNARSLQQELTDLELAQKGAEDKLKRINAELYGGKVVNPREVAALEKEIEMVTRSRDGNDGRILELLDLLPPAKEAAGKIQAKIDTLKKSLVERRKAAVGERTVIEEEFTRLNAARPEAVKAVPPALLAKYESIRQRHGAGMVEVDRRKKTCTGCGTLQSERHIQSLREGRIITCDSCHRILYYTEGAV